MLHRAILAAALAVGLSSAAHAQAARVVPDCALASTLPSRDATSLIVDQFGKLCVSGSDPVVQGTAVYRGGTITTANTSQQLMAANPVRRGWTIQNQSTGDLYVKVGQAATTNNVSLRIAPGALYETPSQHTSAGVINVIGATAGQAYYATEF